MNIVCPNCDQEIDLDEADITAYVNSISESDTGVATAYVEIELFCQECYERLNLGGNGHIELFKN